MAVKLGIWQRRANYILNNLVYGSSKTDVKEQFTRFEAKNYRADWKKHYDLYRAKCREACPDEKALANILVRLGYEKYPKRDKKFMWNFAGDGIVANIKQVEKLVLPKRDSNGKFEYLGRRYSMVEIVENELEWI